MTNENKKPEKEINWEQILKDYGLEENPDEFVRQIFGMTTSLLAVQLQQKQTDEIAVEMGEFELILKRAKPQKKEYNH